VLRAFGADECLSRSPIQPNSVPVNCRFAVANAEHDWEFPVDFDYIHSRMLTLGMHDWPRFFKQVWDNLEPGGWFETSETQFPMRRADGDEPKPSSLLQWSQHVYDAAKKAGIDAQASEKFSEQLAAQGFINIDRVDKPWPIRPWPKGEKYKYLGKLVEENMQAAVPGIAMALFTRHLGWAKVDVDSFCTEVLSDIGDPSNHFYANM
jgi:hypothetical protein